MSMGFDGGTLACTAWCSFDVTACTGDGPSCGNDLAEGLEACDGTDLNNHTCASLGFDGGDLACDACVFDTTACTGKPPLCGDDNAEGLEECDGDDLAQLDCEDLGFDGGVLACDATCRLETGGCTGVAQVCGDGSAMGLEDCDGDDSNGVDCTTLGYDGGTLACDASCHYDAAACTGVAAVCGDEMINGLEECDGDDLGGVQCLDLDYTGGTLACDSSCTFDPTGCTEPVCGNGIQEPGESCDGMDIGGNDCTDLGLGEGDVSCKVDCTFDTSACLLPVCGDGAVNQGIEQCDGVDFSGESCRTLSFRGGQLLCTETCTYDTSFCWGTTAECGDGERAISEPCEGADLGGATCANLGYDGGELSCDGTCNYDLSECIGSGPDCGDGVAEGDEMCDGTDLRGLSCEDFGFTGGALDCSPQCTLSLFNCIHEPECGNDIAERNELCDGTDLRGASCELLDVGTGGLACSPTCDDYDYSGCTLQPECGNDVAEGVEVCDGIDLRELGSCRLFGYASDDPVGCLPTCAEFDLSACTGEPNRCGNNRAQGIEQCDGTDLRNQTCEGLGYDSGDLACNANCSLDVSGCML
jgi:hypothetical protein